jgi:FkbM family methyltransferase
VVGFRTLRRFTPYARPIVQACAGRRITLDGLDVDVPGSWRTRTSVVAGNVRVHRLMDASLRPGALAVDVGAHTGYNALYAAQRVGTSGRVIAIEPAADSLDVLRRNVATNPRWHVDIKPVAAGRVHSTRELFVRGEESAVNSFFAESCYAPVTGVSIVNVEALDDIVDGDPALVKIDVEGAELDVLAGMTRLLALPDIRLIVEWHPVLQELAGYAPEALPRALLQHGFSVYAASHVDIMRLRADDLSRMAAASRRANARPVELFASRTPIDPM